MTDCDNAEMRDLLPDFAADRLAAADRVRVQAHVQSCEECAEELALIRTVQTLRPSAVAIDVAKIVASLPVPARNTKPESATIVSLEGRRRAVASASPVRARGVWRMAATIGVLIAGGWSVLMVRSGGLGLMRVSEADSLQLTEAIVGADTSRRVDVTAGATTSTNGAMNTAASAATAAPGAAVSFGNLGDYTDEELQRVLDRLEQWDGSTSTETVTTTPILPVNRSGADE